MFPTKENTGGLRVPLVSFTGRDPCYLRHTQTLNRKDNGVLYYLITLRYAL